MPLTFSLSINSTAFKTVASLLLLFLYYTGTAQQPVTDTTEKGVALQEVVVRAFEQNRKLKDIGAAVNFINRSVLERFSPASIVFAVNTTQGVRLEERSPGSYRFNIRGSALRSPFGVRNIKVYYNDIPFTDPGGHTYLNNLGYYNFNSLEIIKGPGSSLYGAGTGGVMLIESLSRNEKRGVFGEYTTGSYGLHNGYVSLTTGNDNNKNHFGYQHQQSTGYRTQSELRRDVFSWTGLFAPNEKQFLKTTFLYSDLFYETPGALTGAEYNRNPKAARPAIGAFPSAEGAKASIRQKTFLAGASFTQKLSERFKNTTTLYGAFTELQNPAIRNYGRSSEPHVGGRTLFQYNLPITAGQVSFTGGGELQQNFTTTDVHKNKAGQVDSLQTSDESKTRSSFVFAQASMEVKNWTVTAGVSYNKLNLQFQRFVPVVTNTLERNFSNEVAPRFSLLKKFKQISLYTSVSKGFSPPTTNELLPSGSAVNLGLAAEEGTNYDVGFRATLFKILYADVNGFLFRLKNTIVQRRDAGGGEFFINAGKTKQLGLETYLGYPVLQHSLFVEKSTIWLGHTWHHFKYGEFKQFTTDFSGNKLPGIAPHTIAAGWDVRAKNGLSGTITYYFSDELPLNDANTEYAAAYHLLGLKGSYEKSVHPKIRTRFLIGVDNLLDQQYSLGNDINGFGGRYYNAATGRSYYAGISINFGFKESE